MAGGTTQRSISPPQSAHATVDALEAVNRERPLTSDEEQRLYRALDSIRRRQGKRENWHWSRADKLRLRRHLLNGKKPREIAVMMSRTERAVWREMNKLGWTVRGAEVWIINPRQPL
jgi:hypothetical protein